MKKLFLLFFLCVSLYSTDKLVSVEYSQGKFDTDSGNAAIENDIAFKLGARRDGERLYVNIHHITLDKSDLKAGSGNEGYSFGLEYDLIEKLSTNVSFFYGLNASYVNLDVGIGQSYGVQTGLNIALLKNLETDFLISYAFANSSELDTTLKYSLGIVYKYK